MLFDNNASNVGFIGKRNLEEVLREDSLEIAEVLGSFTAIAARMRYFQAVYFDEKGEKEYEPGLLPIPEQLFYNLSRGSGSGYFSFLEQYHKGKGLIERRFIVWNYAYTNGLQDCPFLGCVAKGQ